MARSAPAGADFGRTSIVRAPIARLLTELPSGNPDPPSESPAPGTEPTPLL